VFRIVIVSKLTLVLSIFIFFTYAVRFHNFTPNRLTSVKLTTTASFGEFLGSSDPLPLKTEFPAVPSSSLLSLEVALET